MARGIPHPHLPNFYKTAKWRNKGFWYWWKYNWRKWPEAMMSIPVFVFVFPASVYHTFFYYNEEMEMYDKRHKMQPIVLRHDDPRINEVYRVYMANKQAKEAAENPQ